jgi:phosphoribosylformimino-5-aminoimidazole carboxamide ribotide isomerase
VSVAPFEIIPAIDLRSGRCVRLVEGRPGTETVYAEDPARQARVFEDAGASRLHLVDLDGAFSGKPENTSAIVAIARAVPGMSIEVGGGLRDREAVERVLEAGARFAILGTMALSNPDLFREICDAHRGRIIAGIDARDGLVATKGWLEVSAVRAIDVAERVASMGAAAIIHTDIARDGTGRGVNADATDEIARAVAIPVFASGGVASLDDVRLLKATAVRGVVVGRALYEGLVDLKEMIHIGGC